MPNRDFFRIRFSAPRLSADNSEAEIMLYGKILTNWQPCVCTHQTSQICTRCL